MKCNHSKSKIKIEIFPQSGVFLESEKREEREEGKNENKGAMAKSRKDEGTLSK